MDVTQQNFQQVLNNLDEDLRKATFLAIDTEFTGIEDDGFRSMPLDTPEERYQKIREGSMKFLIIQFGLSIFSYDHENEQYVYKTYNFYIFPPRKAISGFPDLRFSSQSSCIGFLVSQGFDFNKLFRDGIPYLNLAAEEQLKATIDEKINHIETEKILGQIPKEQKEFVEQAFQEIETFLSTGEMGCLVLDQCNAYQRNLIFSHGKAKFPGAFFQSQMNEKHQRVLIIQKATEEQQRQLKDESDRLDLEEVDNLVGFTKVMRKISQSGKLVVGHNMLLDVCHIIGQFYADLPEDYQEFKNMASAVFPKMIDTKVMATTQPFRDRLPNSTLEPLLRTLAKEPYKIGSIVPAAGFPLYSLVDGKCHEAGYDAFMTGACFIGMFNFLMQVRRENIQSPKTEDEGKEIELSRAPFIQTFLQKLYMMRVNDIPYLLLNGKDVEPSREHIFYLTFPLQKWKTGDIIQLFSCCGPVLVSWIDNSSAFVTLYRKENKHLVIRNLKLPDGCKVVTYQQHASKNKLLHNGTTGSQQGTKRTYFESENYDEVKIY